MIDENQNLASQYLVVMFQNWTKIIAGIFICAISAGLFSLGLSKTYEASTTVLVYPPFFKDTARSVVSGPADKDRAMSLAELMPLSLPLDTYRTLAESKELFRRMIAELGLEDMTVEALSEKCEVALTPLETGRPQGVQLSQSIEFRARDRNPERAALLVETWARLFKESADKLTLGQLDETFGLVESMWESTNNELLTAEDALGAFRQETNVELLQAQLVAGQEKLSELELLLIDVEIDLRSEQASLESIQQSLSEEQKIETLFKAPPDEALWLGKSDLLSETKEGELLSKIGFRTEELNPNYTEFRRQEFDSKFNIAELEAKRDSIVSQMTDLTSRLDSLQRELTLGKTAETRLLRDVQVLEEAYQLVASSLEKGKLAKLNRASDIRFVGDNVEPNVPSGVRRLYIVLMAAMVGAVLSVGYVLIDHILRNADVVIEA